AAQSAGRPRRRVRPGNGRYAEPAQRCPRCGRSFDRRRHRGRARRRAARQRDRRRQPDGFAPCRRAVGERCRYAGGHRTRVQGHHRARQDQSRDAAKEHRQDDGRGGREGAGARRGQGAHLQDPPEGTRCRRLRRDHSGGNPQAQCRPWHQRAAAGRWRAQGDRHRDGAGTRGDFARHPRDAGARRRHADRLGAVRLALCRPQHPAPNPRAAELDEDPLQRRSR
ncbi:hypothetical protein KXW38_009630, partial [Aspergillus fumigatus]